MIRAIRYSPFADDWLQEDSCGVLRRSLLLKQVVYSQFGVLDENLLWRVFWQTHGVPVWEGGGVYAGL